jgi:predicted phosphodiesterase
MADQRILVRGDNHGDTESLGKLVEAAEGEEFNFIIHAGDITNTYKTDLKTGVDQLRGVEPYFETLAERGTLVYIYGN